MSNGNLNWIANYIWGIADDVLRDLYVRGKYRDVILPMTVLRRLDAVLEGSKQAVLDMKASLDDVGVVEQDPALRQAAGQAFYLQNALRLDFRVVEETVSPDRVVHSLARRIDTRLGISGQCIDDLSASSIQTLVPQVDPFKFR